MLINGLNGQFKQVTSSQNISMWRYQILVCVQYNPFHNGLPHGSGSGHFSKYLSYKCKYISILNFWKVLDKYFVMNISAAAVLYSKIYSFGMTLLLFGHFSYDDKLFGLFSKLLASLMRNYFPKRPSGAPLHTFSNYMMFPLDLPPPPILRLCITIFTVAEKWLLLDIVWFVFFSHLHLSHFQHSTCALQILSICVIPI